MRKSFLIYKDSLSVLDELTNEQAGIIFKAIKDFQDGKTTELEFAMKMVFLPFKNQFVRDNENYKKKSEINTVNGSIGGKRRVANATKRKRKLAIQADNDSDNDSVNDNKLLKPHLFKDSKIFDKVKFAETFKDWTKEKMSYYYNAAVEWSGNGKKKTDWELTIKNWNRKDEAEGKINFTKTTYKPLQATL
jgi:hypothetical protein